MEKYNFESGAAENTGEVRRESLWKKVKRISEIAVLSVLLSTAGIETVLGQEKNESPEKVKDRIEQVKTETAEKEQNVIKVVEKKGMTGKIGTMPAKMLRDPAKGLITVGYGQDVKKAEWIYLETPGANLRYFDKDNDGDVDRAILNRSPENARQKSAFNDIDTFAPFEKLTETAKMEADLMPEDKAVFEFAQEGKEFVVRSVEFKTGEVSELSGDEAGTLTNKIQQGYLNALEDFVLETQGK